MDAALIILVINLAASPTSKDFSVGTKAISMHGSITECEKVAQAIQIGLPPAQTAVCARVVR